MNLGMVWSKDKGRVMLIPSPVLHTIRVCDIMCNQGGGVFKSIATQDKLWLCTYCMRLR